MLPRGPRTGPSGWPPGGGVNEGLRGCGRFSLDGLLVFYDSSSPAGASRRGMDRYRRIEYLPRHNRETLQNLLHLREPFTPLLGFGHNRRDNLQPVPLRLPEERSVWRLTRGF